MFRWLKGSLVLAGAALLVGGFVFGKDLVSYVHSATQSVRGAVKESVPIEFELRRAHDLLDQIIPEMQANIRLIAQEEVEVSGLKHDIERSEDAISEERVKIGRIRAALLTPQTSYAIGHYQYTRAQLKEDLARRFDRFREAEVVLSGKQKLRSSRENSLHAAMQVLDRTRSQKTLLEDKIAGLESQYRLVQAASVGSRIEVDATKLAQTERLIETIKKRLDVAERVLAHESRFVRPIEIDTISEEELLSEVDEYFAAPDSEMTAAEATSLQLSRGE